jgi:lysophospholipase L1-like esterase
MKLLVVAIILSTISAKAEPAIWLVGDSTVASYPQKRYPQNGWGQVIDRFCKSGVKVSNHAVGGRSSKSFIDEKRWDRVLDGLKKGDFVLIQFGHNDSKKDKARHTEAASAYQDYLKKYIEDTKAKGAYPILVTSVARRAVKKDKIVNSLGEYPAAMKKVSKETQTPIIDLNTISLKKLNELGLEKSKEVFLHLASGEYPNYPKGRTDNTHFSEKGAMLIAGLVVEDAKKQNLPIAKLFK